MPLRCPSPEPHRFNCITSYTFSRPARGRGRTAGCYSRAPPAGPGNFDAAQLEGAAAHPPSVQACRCDALAPSPIAARGCQSCERPAAANPVNAPRPRPSNKRPAAPANAPRQSREPPAAIPRTPPRAYGAYRDPQALVAHPPNASGYPISGCLGHAYGRSDWAGLAPCGCLGTPAQRARCRIHMALVFIAIGRGGLVVWPSCYY